MPIGGIFNAVNPLSSLALVAAGPAGWMALATKTMLSAVGQQVIQRIGQQLGLPQGVIDLAQSQFASNIGDNRGARLNIREAASALADQFNLTPRQEGELRRAGDSMMDNLNRMLMDRMRESGDQESQAAQSGGAGQKSLLMKIAVAMGQLLDRKMTEMGGLTDDIGRLGTINNSNQSKLGELTGKLQGLGQEVNMLSNAMTNTIKSIGEANTTIARKG
ncbi:MAG: hypothetical protein WA918_04965 [Erythrobacter sp.]